EYDWTYSFDDNKLKEIAEDNISFSQETTDYLMKYGFTIYDTSADRERVLDKIVEDIKREAI
ncbi:MAG: hypothetical protein FWF15_05845, partial [Oscillospiraceae bacterium]|nr:hypothetical protein [Oscillospiraceae bacterium]